MYTGPIKQMPQYPMRDDFDTPRPCSRADELARIDEMRQFEAEERRCWKRRNKAGFEKIDDMRYGGGE